MFGFSLRAVLLITPLATAYGKSYTYLCSIFLFLDDSYSLYCPICICYDTEKENLFDNQGLLKLMIISFIFMNFIFDSRETQKGEMRHHGLLGFSSLTLKSDKHLTSPHKITSESHIQVTRIKKMIIKQRCFWLFNKFSLQVPWEMYREQYGEYANWCLGVKN